MSRTIEFHPAAADEAVAARSWYHEVDVKLGDDFEDELDQALGRISAAPHRWSQHLCGTRCFVLQRFPYLIVYLHTELQIQIVAVQHAKRRAGWHVRVERWCHAHIASAG